MLSKTGIAAGMHPLSWPAAILLAAILLAAVRYILIETRPRWMAVNGALGAVNIAEGLVQVTRI